MKTIWIAQAFVILMCCASLQGAARKPAPTAQAGIVVPDQFRHAEPFVRTLEAGGLVVQSIETTTREGSLGGGRNAALIRTDKGVVEVVVLPGAMDAEQLSITYTKWNGNRHHFHIEGPTLPKPEDSYGSQFPYFTLHRSWFIVTYEPGLDGIIKRILGQVPAR